MEPQPLSEEQLERYRPSKIWKSLDAERRHAAAEAFWASDIVKDVDKAAAIDALATAMRFRPQTIRTAPPARKAGFLAGCPALGDPVTGTLLYVYHMERQVPLMSRFLDALGIKHEKGKIEDEVTPPDAEAAAKAVEAILAEFDRGDVHLYLRTLVSQDDVTWAALLPVVESWKD